MPRRATHRHDDTRDACSRLRVGPAAFSNYRVGKGASRPGLGTHDVAEENIRKLGVGMKFKTFRRGYQLTGLLALSGILGGCVTYHGEVSEIMCTEVS